jgi:hypothetical protein
MHILTIRTRKGKSIIFYLRGNSISSCDFILRFVAFLEISQKQIMSVPKSQYEKNRKWLSRKTAEELELMKQEKREKDNKRNAKKRAMLVDVAESEPMKQNKRKKVHQRNTGKRAELVAVESLVALSKPVHYIFRGNLSSLSNTTWRFNNGTLNFGLTKSYFIFDSGLTVRCNTFYVGSQATTDTGIYHFNNSKLS